MKIFLEGIKVVLDHAEHISNLQIHVKPYFSDFECSEYRRHKNANHDPGVYSAHRE